MTRSLIISLLVILLSPVAAVGYMEYQAYKWLRWDERPDFSFNTREFDLSNYPTGGMSDTGHMPKSLWLSFRYICYSAKSIEDLDAILVESAGFKRGEIFELAKGYRSAKYGRGDPLLGVYAVDHIHGERLFKCEVSMDHFHPMRFVRSGFWSQFYSLLLQPPIPDHPEESTPPKPLP